MTAVNHSDTEAESPHGGDEEDRPDAQASAGSRQYHSGLRASPEFSVSLWFTVVI